MNRRPQKRGAIPAAASAFLPPLVRQMFPLYSFYGLVRPMAVRIALPQIARVEIRVSSQDKLCGNYIRAEDHIADILRQKANEELAKKKLPPTRTIDHIYLQVQFAPQIVYHQPFHSKQTMPGGEVDPIMQVGVNFVFHDDHHSGLEIGFVVQGSYNYFWLDPNANDPHETAAGRHAWQAQYQLQAAYAFVDLFGVDGLTLDILVQAARAITYQYDPTQQRSVTSRSTAISGGIQVTKQLGDSPFSIGGQVTVGSGPSPTLDWTGQFIFQWQYDLRPKPKKPEAR